MDVNEIREGDDQNDNLRPHLENIKFLKAYYGHCKAYIECHPTDNGAFQIEGGKWLTEMDVTHGANWQVRHSKLQFRDWLYEQKISPDFLKKCLNELFHPKKKWVAAIDMDSGNYFPKEITEDQVMEAKKEGLNIYDTEWEAQKECDHENSL